MLAWVFLASRYSVDASLPLVERVLSVLYVVFDVLVLLGTYDPSSPVEAGWSPTPCGARPWSTPRWPPSPTRSRPGLRARISTA